MPKEGKDFRIHGVRQSLIGDAVVALPVLNYLEKQYPNSYKYWHLAKKCAQAGQLFSNQPLIDEVVISEVEEGYGPSDKALAESCDVAINTTPQHPFGEHWHNHRNMVEETWVMAGLPIEEYHNLSEEEKIPKLHKWFPIEKKPKTIAVHCFAAYGKQDPLSAARSPRPDWWPHILDLLIDAFDCDIWRLGHPAEPEIKSASILHRGHDFRGLSFFDQVKKALSADVYIGTDSGFSLTMGAYSQPQVTLLTNWNTMHMGNLSCLAPLNKFNINIFRPIIDWNKGERIGDGCSSIEPEALIEAVAEAVPSNNK